MKQRSAQVPTSADRLESAAAWLVKLEALGEAQPAPEELQAWDHWAADQANRAAFDELAALRQQLKRISSIRRPTRAELLADRLSDANPHAVAASGMASRRSGVLVLAASVLLAFTIFAALRFSNSSFHPFAPTVVAMYSTGTGGQRHVQLPDGSIVTMGGATVLSVAYTSDQRNITLDRGEALFQVVHNVARPFRVYAGTGVITDVGTKFNVLRTAQRVAVTVTEGAVEVTPVIQAVGPPGSAELPPPKWLAVSVAHGEAMSYQSQGEATAVEQVDSRLAIAWTRGTLVYDARPLSEVIDDVTRYWDHPVRLGPGTSELLYSGTVGERHIGAWIRGLPNIFPVKVTESNDGKIAIRLLAR